MSEIITDADGKRWQTTPRGLRSLDVDEPTSNGHAQRTSWTAAELLADDFPEPRFAVDGLLPEGLSFMAGAPKLGKSWMALGLGIAVASGGRALGSVPVEAGDVLYLALEDSPRRLQSRLRTLVGDENRPNGSTWRRSGRAWTRAAPTSSTHGWTSTRTRGSS